MSLPLWVVWAAVLTMIVSSLASVLRATAEKSREQRLQRLSTSTLAFDTLELGGFLIVVVTSLAGLRS